MGGRGGAAGRRRGRTRRGARCRWLKGRRGRPGGRGDADRGVREAVRFDSLRFRVLSRGARRGGAMGEWACFCTEPRRPLCRAPPHGRRGCAAGRCWGRVRARAPTSAQAAAGQTAQMDPTPTALSALRTAPARAAGCAARSAPAAVARARPPRTAPAAPAATPARPALKACGAARTYTRRARWAALASSTISVSRSTSAPQGSAASRAASAPSARSRAASVSAASASAPSASATPAPAPAPAPARSAAAADRALPGAGGGQKMSCESPRAASRPAPPASASRPSPARGVDGSKLKGGGAAQPASAPMHRSGPRSRPDEAGRLVSAHDEPEGHLYSPINEFQRGTCIPQ